MGRVKGKSKMSSNNFVQSVIGSPAKVERKGKYLSKSEEWRVNLARIMLTGVFNNQYYRSAQSAVDEQPAPRPEGREKIPLSSSASHSAVFLADKLLS